MAVQIIDHHILTGTISHFLNQCYPFFFREMMCEETRYHYVKLRFLQIRTHNIIVDI